MTTTVKQIQEKEDYHISCQNCGTTEKPLHILPLRDKKHVVGLIFTCDDCNAELAGQRFDREIKFNHINKP